MSQCNYIQSPTVWSWNCTDPANNECADSAIGCCPESATCSVTMTPANLVSSRLPFLTPDPTTSTPPTDTDIPQTQPGSLQQSASLASASTGTATAQSSGHSSHTVSIVVGVVVGVVGLLLIVAIVLLLLLLRKRKHRQDEHSKPDLNDTDTVPAEPDIAKPMLYNVDEKVINDDVGMEFKDSRLGYSDGMHAAVELPGQSRVQNTSELGHSGLQYPNTLPRAAELDAPSDRTRAYNTPYESHEMGG